MSTGRWFVNILRSLQYPKSNDLQPEGCDWLFDNEAIVPFLEWFCDNLGPDNVLTTQEIRQLKQLQVYGDGLLEGDNLEKALHVASMSVEEDISVEQLREEISILEEDICAVEKRKALLAHQRNCLSLQQTSVTHKLSKLGSLESKAKHRYKNTREQQQTSSALLDASTEDLKATFNDLLALYHPVNQQQQHEPFLSQKDLHPYHEAEFKFTQELKFYSRKQFFEGIGDLAGCSQSEDFQLLEISDPASLLVKGEKPQVRENESREYARLKSLYAKSQKRRMKGKLEEKRVMAAHRYAQKCAEDIQELYPADIKTLSKRLQEAQAQKERISEEITSIWEGAIPQLLEKNAELQVTHVLSGDYRLKIIRQDYFASKQDELIRQLVVQRARNYFLNIGFEEEEKDHKKLHFHLTALEQMLEECQHQHAARMSMMSDSCLEIPKTARNTVNSKDQSLTRLHTTIGAKPEGDKQQLFLTFKDILQSTNQLYEDVTKVRNGLISTNENQDKRLATLEYNIRLCESTVSDGQSDSQPLMTSSPIRNGINQLDKMLQNLEQSILEVMGEYNNKLKVLKGDQLQAIQRHLFIYFFLQPEQLHREIRALMDRLQALNVS